MTLPLAGIRVLDFCQVWAGPLCGRLLSDLGAEVVKIEGLSRIDGVRTAVLVPREPSEEFWNQGYYFAFPNLGKKDVTIDTTAPGGVELLQQLVFEGNWDIILESFTPRVFENWGIGPAVLAERLPSLILLSISAYGHDGPWRDYRAFGNGIEPASGVSSLNGYRGGPPMRSAIALSDPLAGLLAASMAVAAVRKRRRTGKGEHLVLSQYESAIPLIAEPLMDWTMNGVLPERIGNRSRTVAPQGCYRCEGDDDWLVISCRTDGEWRALCGAIGRPELADDPRLHTVEGRRHHHDEIDDAIGAWAAGQDHIAAFHALQAAGVTAMPVLNGKESLLDPHHAARRFRHMGEIPGSGAIPYARQLVARFRHTEVRTARRPPRLGEHNAEVLGAIGKGPAELAALESAGVIGTKPNYAQPFEAMRQELTLPVVEEMANGQILRIEPDFKRVLGLDTATIEGD